jgi:two-component system chemotaxis sensor kinase CheA
MIRTSLRAKLVRNMIATLVVVATATLVVVAGMNVVSSGRTLITIEEHLRVSIEDKGRGLVVGQALALRDLVSDNAFGDVARLMERTIAKDQDLVYGLFVDEVGKSWGFAANKSLKNFPTDWKALGLDLKHYQTPGVKRQKKLVAEQSVFEFAMPVVDDKGQRLGILFYTLSDEPLRQALEEARSDSRRSLFLTVGLLGVLGILAIILGILLSRRSAARITQPVTDLTTAVNTLAAGRREIRVAIASGDELESLGNAFNNMAEELQESYSKLEMMNRTLEQKVEERTRELAQRNRDMRLVMDNVEQGFLTLTPDGVLAVERFTIIDRWFGPFGAGIRYVDYMQQMDPMYAASFGMGLEAITDDVLPLELCIDQLPARLRWAGKEFRCTYTPIIKGERFDGLLVVINDVTAELFHARQEAERKEILAMFEALTKDRTGFLSFMDEANELIGHLVTANIENQKRILHTLKGNAGLVGFTILSQMCHQMEDTLVEERQPLPEPMLAPLIERWRMLTASLKNFLGDKGRDVIELTSKEVDRVAEMVRSGAPSMRILDRLASWWLEASELPLNRLGRYAVALSKRLGKFDLEIHVKSNGIRLAPKAWAGFWTDLVHVVRNAVDHGIEGPNERAAAGKPKKANLRFETRLQAGRKLVVEIEDDGRGIAWEMVREAARKMGVPSATQEDLLKAIFTSGVSTQTEVTTLSGRGIGLSAVKQQVEDLGGSIAVDSQPGKGTCFRFIFTLPDISPRFGIDVEEDTVSNTA